MYPVKLAIIVRREHRNCFKEGERRWVREEMEREVKGEKREIQIKNE